ncbi:MAG: AgmX/PglI C-terminal domain-containing protein [Myxococcaceae bacterium]|nr:AgmX/PglI C-terminal domain-containing protein [Myxococcaceae bacterium]
MNVALSRRSVGCVSDLTIDRWLLGETPGSDEARRLEQHLETCRVCAARLGSLRSLYSSQPEQTPPATAHVLDSPPRQSPSESGVVQVIVMRDGLLVGTEYFTPGQWTVGSAQGCDLSLVDGPATKHAALVFHAGTVAIEAREGPVFVNGVRLARAEVRPIDEVWVGPYALRVRVITERWSWPAMMTSPQPAAERTTVIEAPVVKDTHLHVALWWSDARLATVAVQGALTTNQVRDLGFEQTVSASRDARGRWVVETPTGPLTLSVNEATSIEAGPLRLVLSVAAKPGALERARTTERLFPAVLVCVSVVASALLVSMPEPSEEDFVPRPMPVVKVHVTPPMLKPPTPATPASAPTVAPVATAQTPSRRPQRASPPPPRNRFEALDRIMNSASSMSAALSARGSPSKTKRPQGPLLAMPGVGAPNFHLGVATDAASIGRRGAGKGGEMRGGGYGVEGKIGGIVVDRVRPSGLGVPPKKAGGSIDRDAVAKVINEHLQEVQRCYEASLLMEGSAGGRLAVEWTISTSGAVTNAKVQSTTVRQASVPQCVLAALRRWPFPPAKGGHVVVSYPFVFQSSSYRN